MHKQIQQNVISVIILSICSLLYSGCASSATRATGSVPKGSFKVSEERKLGEVSVSLSPEAKEKLKDNLKFDHDALRRQIEKAFDASSLLDVSKKGEFPSLTIVVTDMRVRSNFSAVVWGVMAGADSIKGDVVIKDASGRELDRFRVSASYALGGIAGGQDGARMDWLYEAFAKETLKELTGKK